ncbi:MAG: hypothetical protein H0T76_19535 [Nannocystis sp.]|nr:hypothetical protein [Nannocystis sp.]MBA3548684.1 hypothetical protein [Nannocystis sp.]
MRPTIVPFLLSLTFLPACTVDGGDTESATEGTTAGTAGGTTDEPTGGTTGEPADLNALELGANASELCVSAMTHAAKLTQAIAGGDAAAATAAYLGTDLQTFVQQFKTEAERLDDPAIAASLALGTPADLAAAEGRLHSALVRHMRDHLSAVETGTDDRYAGWDEVHCVWTGALRSLAVEADAVGWHSVDESIAADVDAALEAGHDGISGAPPTTAIDDWRVPPAKQIVEKSLYRAAQRMMIELAANARDNADAVAASRALALFGIVKDRLEGRNTPGIAQIEAMLAGDPAMIDPAAILTELDIAFAKRTRAYSAIIDVELGTPTGYKSAIEGRTYARLIAPGLAERVSGANVAAFIGEWEAYPELVRAGTDLENINALSQRLVDATCAYQAALGVAECTPEADETK